jgi:hypothetical protein
VLPRKIPKTNGYHAANIAYFDRITGETATALVDSGEKLQAALDALIPQPSEAESGA